MAMNGQPVMGGYGQPAGGGGGSSSTYFAPPPGTTQAAEGYTDANLAYQRALARFNQQRTGLLQQYGYKGTVDPTTGLMSNVGVDTGNSYGSLQQLLHNQANEDQQAEYGAEDRGLVGGLAHQGASELAYGHHAQSSALANSLFGSLSDINGQQLDAKNSLDQALWQLQHGATTDAIDSGSYNPADLSGTDGGNDGGGGGRAPAAPTGAALQQGSSYYVAPSRAPAVAKASMAAKLVAQAQKKSAPAVALAARSAGLNAAYGLGTKPAPKKAAPKPKATYKGRH